MKISGVTYRHPFANTTGGTGAGGQVLSGRSFQFDGVADRVACDAAAAANTLDWDGVKRWTVSCWFKDPSTAYATLWSMCPTIPGANRFLEIASYYSGGVGRIRLQARAASTNFLTVAGATPSGSAGFIEIRSTDPNGIDPNDGNWHNVVLTVNSALGQVDGTKVYLDGLLAGKTTNDPAETNTFDFLKVGCRVQTNNTVFGPFFPGRCFRFSIYDGELSAAEVAAIYNGGQPVDERALTPAPLNFYRFGNGDYLFPVVKDYGTGGADGLAVNMIPGDIVGDAP